MIVLAALAAALVRAAIPVALPGAVGDVVASADHATYEVGTERVLLEGNVVIRRGTIVLRARSATWDRATAEVRAAGGVLLTDPTRAISADAIRAVLGGEIEAEGVLAFVKDRPVDLSGVRTMEEARAAGRNRVTFSGQRLSGATEDRLALSGARLTLCDCAGGAPPSWEVTARSADVVPRKRAILHWSIVRIAPPFVHRTVPVLILPWLYLPLGERQSGLLIPVVGSTGATGFSIAEPLYLTLGRSADLTLTPEYAFGRSRSDVAAGKPAVRGPGASLELRFAPARDAEGAADLAWIHDLDREPGGEGGDRWGLTALHRQRLGAGTVLQAGIRLAGDAVWVRDMSADVLGRAVPYRRSDLLVSQRRDDAVAEAVASYLQPFQPEGSPPVDRYGTLGAAMGVASRWGSGMADLLPVPVGPLRLSAHAGASRFSDARAGLDVAERPGVTRADARSEISAPFLVGGAVTIAPFIRGAALGYGFDEAKDPTTSAWGIAGTTVETELSRRYGAVRHAIAPHLEWRAGTGAAGQVLPFPAFDAYDRSSAALLTAAPGSFQQLRASVENRLSLPGSTLARAEIGQDLDLRAGRFAETFAALALNAGPVKADARASFFGVGSRPIAARAPLISSPLDRFTELRGNLSVQDGRGDSVRAGFLAVGPGGSGTLVAGIDPLFDLRPADIEPTASATAGVTARLGSARVGYDALLAGRGAIVPACEGTGTRRVGAFHVQQHAATFAWESSCHCFRITAVARLSDCGDVAYSASVDLAGLTRGLMR